MRFLCVCVCVSVTFVHCVKTNNVSSYFFHRRVATPFPVFLYQMPWQYSDGNPLNGGVECRWGRIKSRNQWLSGLAINNCCTVVCILHSAAGFCLQRVLDDQARSTRCCVLCEIDQARSCTIHSQSRWTWIVCTTALQEGWTLRRRQHYRTESNFMHWLIRSRSN